MKVLYIHKKCVQLYTLQEGKCFYCQLKVEYQKLTRDHFNPKFKGFKAKYNVVLACGKCNSEKGHKTVYEFREFACSNLAAYLRNILKKNPNSGQDRTMLRYTGVIQRCTYLLKNPEAINDVVNAYYKVNYDKALEELSKTNKLVPYLMTKTSDLFG